MTVEKEDLVQVAGTVAGGVVLFALMWGILVMALCL